MLCNLKVDLPTQRECATSLGAFRRPVLSLAAPRYYLRIARLRTIAFLLGWGLALLSGHPLLLGGVTPVQNSNVSSFTAGALTLYAGQSVRSNNGQHRLIMQADGNLVLYHINWPVFATGTNGTGATKAVFQSDGNLVVYNPAMQAKWNSRTAGNPGSRIVVQEAGNLVIYNASGKAIWNTWWYSAGANDNIFTNHLITGNNALTKVVNPTYPTADVVVADYDVVSDLAADNTGVSEASGVIQDALNRCAANGGGTVWLPSGKYRISQTIHIPPFCFLRGDWRDPDLIPTPTTDISYGTIILATLGSSNPNLSDGGISAFKLEGPGGLSGVTIYYPNQAMGNVTPYGYSIVAANTCVMFMIENITLINSYAGISIGPDATTGNAAHELARLKNIKGTALVYGLTVNNSSDVDVFENVIFDSKYWSTAGSYFNPPTSGMVNAYTLANGTAFSFRNMEQCQFSHITASNYNNGVVYNPRVRDIGSSGVFIGANITQCHIALLCYPSSLDDRMGLSFAGGTLSGDIWGVYNNSGSAWIMGNQTNILGSTYGIIADGTTFPRSSSLAAIPAYPLPSATSVPRTSGTTFRDVSVYPYNVIRMQVNWDGSIPTQDCDATPGIQQALNDVATAGGGIVYLPAGWYAIATHLVVPANVELRGAGTGPGYSGGTTLFGFEGESSPTRNTDPALITLNGNYAGVSGLKIFYPGDNLFNGVPVCYPASVRGNGSNVYVRNVNVTGGTIGVDFHSAPCDQHYIENLSGWATSAMVHAGNGTGTIRTVHSNGSAVNRASFGIQKWDDQNERGSFNSIGEANLTFVLLEQPTIGSASNGEVITNVFAFGPHQGVYNLCPNTTVFNLGTDCLGGDSGSTSGYNTVATQPITVVNTSMTTGAGPTYGYAPYGIITYYNWTFFGQTGIN